MATCGQLRQPEALDTQGKTHHQKRLICRQRRKPVRMANSKSNQKRREGFAIAQDPFRKKQDQEQKRFLRRSHGEDSRKPIAIRTNQAIQRARSRALKAVYAKGELMIFVETSNIPKSRHTPPPLDKLKPTDKPKRSNRSAKPSKKPRRKPHRAATSPKRN